MVNHASKYLMISRRTRVWRIKLDWSRNSWDYFHAIEGALIMERNYPEHNKIGVFEIDGGVRSAVLGGSYFVRVPIINLAIFSGQSLIEHRHLKMDNTTS